MTIAVTGDTAEERDEHIVIQFGNRAGAVMGGFLGTRVRHHHERRRVARDHSGLASNLEGYGGDLPDFVYVPVHLSKPSARVVSVDFRTVFVPGAPGSQAEPFTDYGPNCCTMSFSPALRRSSSPWKSGVTRSPSLTSTSSFSSEIRPAPSWAASGDWDSRSSSTTTAEWSPPTCFPQDLVEAREQVALASNTWRGEGDTQTTLDQPTSPNSETGYLFDNRAPEAEQRFDTLASTLQSGYVPSPRQARDIRGVALLGSWWPVGRGLAVGPGGRIGPGGGHRH